MAIEDLLDHKCDIYHLKKINKSVGFGLSESISFEYGDIPDLKNVICHFGVESLDSSVEQKAPKNILNEKIKLTLPIGTDIRINDKVVDCNSGLEYTAERPRNIRNNHIFVYIKRTKEQEALQ
ncbi:DUF3599 family protein [Porcipelethomonas sp.]|uniref:DUF3599 family protein n=1 Tax=Porcipelethomonas sp. TaxID=2981675 RepID=UPI003EF781FB